jgi:ABC-type phosphate/phosphonate transport system substrate-binding protein
MSKRNSFFPSWLLGICLLASYIPSVAAADLILTAPPRETVQRGKEMYDPIAKKLTEALGQKVVYKHPKSWADYATKMRDGYYDIVFDGPHFVAWRQKNLKHIPVVSLPGSLEFYVVTNKNNDQINNKRDLIGRKICGMPSPHLATDLVFDIFKNPVIQPVIYEVRGGQRKSYKAFKEGKCQATIFRTTLYKRLPDKIRNTLKIVAKTRALPNQTISVSQRLHDQTKVIADTLLSKDGKMVADKLLSRFSKRKKKFIRADPKKFVGAADILEGVVWGW